MGIYNFNEDCGSRRLDHDPRPGDPAVLFPPVSFFGEIGGNTIQGNYIGVDPTGSQAYGNGQGSTSRG